MAEQASEKKLQPCSNCGEPLQAGEAIKPDGKGGWRHPSKCGDELRGMKVTHFDRSKLLTTDQK